MNAIKQIENYMPINDQEREDKKIILELIKQYSNVLTRENKIAHFTSSALIFNKTLDKVLMVHHNIRQVYSWTGGHTDGDDDFLRVALKEAKEETGVDSVVPLSNEIASIDILCAMKHLKNHQYVNTHLHLSVAYLFQCDENVEVKVCEGENSAVEWILLEDINEINFSRHDVYLYKKLIKKAILIK